MSALIADVVEGYKMLDPARQQIILDLIARLVAEQRAERAATV